MVLRWRLIAVTEVSDFAPVSTNELLNIQTTTDCQFDMKFVSDMIKDTVKCIVRRSTHISAQSLVAFGQMVECSFKI